MNGNHRKFGLDPLSNSLYRSTPVYLKNGRFKYPRTIRLLEGSGFYQRLEDENPILYGLLIVKDSKYQKHKRYYV